MAPPTKPPTDSSLLTRLPDELLAYIIQSVPLGTLFSLRATCTRMRRFLDDAAVWYEAISMTLRIPRTCVESILRDPSPMNIQQKALRIHAVNQLWHEPRSYPRRIRTYQWPDLCDIQMLPGGGWLVCLSTNGTVQLRRMDRALTTAFTIPQAVDMASFSSSCTTVSPYDSFWVLFHCTQRLYIYEVIVVAKPAMRLALTMSKSELGPPAVILRNASIAGNIVGFDCFWDGRDLLCLRTITPNADGQHEQAAFIYSKTDCTIHVLSRNTVILSDASSIEVHRIPDLRPVGSCEHLEIVKSEIICKREFDIVSPGNMTGSPAVWDSANGGHVGPLTMIGPGVLHIVQPSHDLESFGIRSFRVPELISPCPAVGTCYALCPQPEPGGGWVFWTVKHPRVVRVSEDVEARLLHVEPDYVPRGRFTVREIDRTGVVATRLDEWTGRACVILEHGPNGRTLGIFDIV